MIKKYIKRKLYISRLKPYFGKNIIKVIIGQRRVGKSYLLFQIMEELAKHGKKSREREFGNLLAVKDNHPKVVISMDEAVGENYKGIKHMNIREFLSDFVK